MSETVTLLDIMEIAPEWYDKSELVIEPRSLLYGIYKLKFHSRMWDDNDEDPNWTRKLPFERDASTYIEILPTPLIANILDGGLRYITRGKGQILNMEPEVWSVDPDFPEAMVCNNTSFYEFKNIMIVSNF